MNVRQNKWTNFPLSWRVRGKVRLNKNEQIYIYEVWYLNNPVNH